MVKDTGTHCNIFTLKKKMEMEKKDFIPHTKGMDTVMSVQCAIYCFH